MRAALTRGACIAAANWPLVLFQFLVVATYRAAVAVPVVGGIFVAAVLVGGDMGGWLAEDLRAATGLVAASLAGRPEALVTFLVAVGLVAVGGATVVFLMQAGAGALLVDAESRADATQRGPFTTGLWRAAAVFSLAGLFAGMARFGGRFLRLGAWLCLAYAIVGLVTLSGVWALFLLMVGGPWSALGSLGTVIALAATAVVLGAINLAYVLIQVIVVTEDVGLRRAVSRLAAFVRHDARQVAGVFGVVTALGALAWAASLLATAGLALIAWVPIVGLAVVPLQMAAWLVRGLVFDYMALAAWSAYQSQYRRFVDPALDEPPALWVSRA